MGLPKVDRLNPTEEAFWRSLMRIALSLPGRLDSDLTPTVGITANEYLTLMSLSEAPRGELRMTILANETALSASRMTRLVDELQARGLVTKRASAEDGRGNVASLTSDGLAQLREAWGVHVSRVRALVLDHVDSASISDAAQTLSDVAARLEGQL
jgi:DNA-binding MarR family transcriptional regulator